MGRCRGHSRVSGGRRPGGIESRRFGAATSGQALLYAADGRLLFAGGITESRGHRATTRAARRSPRSSWSGGSGRAGHTPVYGCPLFDESSACPKEGTRMSSPDNSPTSPYAAGRRPAAALYRAAPAERLPPHRPHVRPADGRPVGLRDCGGGLHLAAHLGRRRQPASTRTCWAAVFLGGAISSFPILLALLKPGRAPTRYVISVAQMLWSALLIHLTGGRIETHFHVFGSLAFLAFYRDWRVLIPATVVVAADHLLRGLFFPQSVYGVLDGSSWRWLEHAAWVVFEDVFLDRLVRARADRRCARSPTRAADLNAAKEVGRGGDTAPRASSWPT